MTDLKFKINNTDFSGMVEKWSYITDCIPVVGAKYTDLNKVDHTTIARYRGTLEVTLNPSSPAQMTALFTQLATSPVTVDYHCFQTATDVQQTMTFSMEPLQDAAKRSSGHWTRKVKLTFTEE